MNEPQHRSLRWVAGLLTAAACFSMAAPPVFPEESEPVSSGQMEASAPQPPPEGAIGGRAAGMMIYIDPQTGAILKEPAPGTMPLQLTPALQNAISTSHQGLVEVPSAVPGGGVKVDLRGRFQSPLLVTIDANGKARMQHLDEIPDSGDMK
jgi:hypothetical protein